MTMAFKKIRILVTDIPTSSSEKATQPKAKEQTMAFPMALPQNK